MAIPGLLAPALAPQPLSALPADLQPLARELQTRGFRLRIARQTFLHEAVHAVQSCPHGVLTPIGWRYPLAPVVDREISGILTTRYHHGNRALEQEAFGIQGQHDAVARLMEALKRRCPAKPRS